MEVDISVIRPVSHTLMVHLFRHPWNEVRRYLQDVPGQVLDIYNSVDDMWSFITSILHNCLDTFAPLHSAVCKRSHHPTPWLTSSLLAAIKQKQKGRMD